MLDINKLSHPGYGPNPRPKVKVRRPPWGSQASVSSRYIHWLFSLFFVFPPSLSFPLSLPQTPFRHVQKPREGAYACLCSLARKAFPRSYRAICGSAQCVGQVGQAAASGTFAIYGQETGPDRSEKQAASSKQSRLQEARNTHQASSNAMQAASKPRTAYANK